MTTATPVITVAAAVQDALLRLTQAGVDTARLDAQVLLGFVLGIGREGVFAHPERGLTDIEHKRFDELIARREAREPVSQLVSQREFWGRDFVVTSNTLSPRPDTETLVEAVLNKLAEASPTPQALRILDLGTGTGCLILTLLAEIDGATGVGIDASKAALDVARINRRALGLDVQAEFVCGDWCAGLSAGTKFDVIVSNPPYISDDEWPGLAPEVAKYEPEMALRGGVDGLAPYRVLGPQVARHLAPGGFAVFEFGVAQCRDVVTVLEDSGLKMHKIFPDLTGIDRAVIVGA
jgi:release factor glutamine methyltransferase